MFSAICVLFAICVSVFLFIFECGKSRPNLNLT